MASQLLYSPEEVKNLMSQGNTVVIDIRDEEDYKENHIPESVSVHDVF